MPGDGGGRGGGGCSLSTHSDVQRQPRCAHAQRSQGDPAPAHRVTFCSASDNLGPRRCVGCPAYVAWCVVCVCACGGRGGTPAGSSQAACGGGAVQRGCPAHPPHATVIAQRNAKHLSPATTTTTINRPRCHTAGRAPLLQQGCKVGEEGVGVGQADCSVGRHQELALKAFRPFDTKAKSTNHPIMSPRQGNQPSNHAVQGSHDLP